MRIALSIGHGLRDPGAINKELFEHLEAYKITWLLRNALEAKGHAVELISCFQMLAAKIRNVNALHETKPFDLALEIHFNSAADPKANGTEVLYFSPRNQDLAARMSLGLSKALGLRNRGAVKRDNLGWLKQTAPPALIVEVLFISSPADCSIIDTTFHRRVADALTSSL
jgi:N-acetylmuramoyl-L-alanine amidase